MKNITERIKAIKEEGYGDREIQTALMGKLSENVRGLIGEGYSTDKISEVLGLPELESTYPEYHSLVSNTIAGLDKLKTETTKPIERKEGELISEPVSTIKPIVSKAEPMAVAPERVSEPLELTGKELVKGVWDTLHKPARMSREGWGMIRDKFTLNEEDFKKMSEEGKWSDTAINAMIYANAAMSAGGQAVTDWASYHLTPEYWILRTALYKLLPAGAVGVGKAGKKAAETTAKVSKKALTVARKGMEETRVKVLAEVGKKLPVKQKIDMIAREMNRVIKQTDPSVLGAKPPTEIVRILEGAGRSGLKLEGDVARTLLKDINAVETVGEVANSVKHIAISGLQKMFPELVKEVGVAVTKGVMESIKKEDISKDILNKAKDEGKKVWKYDGIQKVPTEKGEVTEAQQYTEITEKGGGTTTYKDIPGGTTQIKEGDYIVGGKYDNVSEIAKEPIKEVTGEKALIDEAKKYKSAEEFIGFMRGSATQYRDYNPELRAKYGLFEDSDRISNLGVDPEREVTIYRGVPDVKTQKIIDGDFVTVDRLSAESYGGKENVVSKKVTAKDLITDSVSEFDKNKPFELGAEFVYSDSKNKLTPLSDKQLTDIYNKATGGVEEEVDPDILKELNQGKTPDEVIEKIPEVTESVGILEDLAADSSGEVLVPDLSPLKKLYNKTHDALWAFGRAKREYPELHEKSMEAFAKKNAGVDKGIDLWNKATVKKQYKGKDKALLSMLYEQKGQEVPEELKDIYKAGSDILKTVEKNLLAEGVLSQTFQETKIADNEEKIKKLREKILDEGKEFEIKNLLKENELYRSMRYLPHKIVAQKVIETKLSKIKGKENRKVFLDKAVDLSAKFKKREGKGLLKDYLDSGLLEAKDIYFDKLVMETVIDYYAKSAMQELHGFAKQRGLIKPSSETLKNEGWETAREVGIYGKEFEGKMISPLYAGILKEMKEMKQGKSGAIRNFLSMVKVGQFIKPTIILVYDVLQKYMFAGAYSFNPIKEMKYLIKAFLAVLNQNEDFHEMNKNNLYSFPYDVPKAQIDEQIKLATRKTLKEIPDYIKKLEAITKTSWAGEDVTVQSILMAAYRVMADVTWTGDKILRTQSTYMLEDMGYSRKEATAIAAKGHGAYSDLSTKYKRMLSPLFFVYSFRILMPREIINVATEPVGKILSAMKGNEKVKKRDINRWSKKILAVLAIPIATDQYLKARGWKRDKAGWKWSKTVIDPTTDREHEVVLSLNNILNMPLKWWHRATKYNPISPKHRIVQSIEGLFKWEIHPAYRYLNDVITNEKSFGEGNVYDPNLASEGVSGVLKQVGQAASYFFGNTLRLYGKLGESFDVISKSEKAELDRVSKLALGDTGRVIANIFGYTYVRSNLQQRRGMMMKSLERETSKRLYEIARQYKEDPSDTPEMKKQKEKAMGKSKENIKEWSKYCVWWIKNKYK